MEMKAKDEGKREKVPLLSEAEVMQEMVASG